MVRVLTILTAVVALAVSAQPAAADASNKQETKLAKGRFVHPTEARLGYRLSWRQPNPRREQTFQLQG